MALDDAWPQSPLGLPAIDLRDLGPSLRYITRSQDLAAFSQRLRDRRERFFVYGSGDFHHLTATLIARATSERPLTVVCFDNHPDWDIRPPYQACGAWVSRALELPGVERVAVWGCGNFELSWPHRLFRNRRALAEGRLQIFAWSERQPQAVQRRFECVTRANWRQKFQEFAHSLAGQDVYVTIDMDCLSEASAVTNWEAGLFTPDDLVWALSALRQGARIVAGDLCGAASAATYARRFQRLAAWWDHPKLKVIEPSSAQTMNLKALSVIWPALAPG